jgi:hypothetical protein
MSTEQSFETFESFDEGGDSFETFDSMPELSEEDFKEAKKEEGKEKVNEDLKVIKDSQADSDGKVIKEDKAKEETEEDDKKEVKKVKKEEEEKKEVKDSSEKEEKAEDGEKKPKLRMKMNEELYNVNSDATFKVKIDGKVEDVPVQELINNYSGKTAWDKKFTELGKEKKTLETEKASLTKEKSTLIEHLNRTLAPLKNKEANPLDSLMYLVEMSGEDPYNAYRRIMEANLTELSSLLDMTEVERELYFHKKKDELYGKVAKQRYSKEQEEKSFNQVLQKVDALRQAYNVSEDEFVDASEELESLLKGQGLDANGVTEEQIVDYASLKPHIATVRGLIEPFEDNISEEKYGDVVANLARSLRNGEIDKEGISKLLKRNFSVEEDVKELNTKVYNKQKGKPSKIVEEETTNKFESFDDF